MIIGERTPFYVDKGPLPKGFIMHSEVADWLHRAWNYVDDGHVFGTPICIDDNQPRATTWKQILEVSRAANFVKLPNTHVVRQLTTEQILKELNSRGYVVQLVKTT